MQYALIFEPEEKEKGTERERERERERAHIPVEPAVSCANAPAIFQDEEETEKQEEKSRTRQCTHTYAHAQTHIYTRSALIIFACVLHFHNTTHARRSSLLTSHRTSDDSDDDTSHRARKLRAAGCSRMSLPLCDTTPRHSGLSSGYRHFPRCCITAWQITKRPGGDEHAFPLPSSALDAATEAIPNAKVHAVSS